MTNIEQFNLFALKQLPSYHNVWIIFAMVLAIYMAHLFYFENNGITAQIVREVLLDKSNQRFVTPDSLAFKFGRWKGKHLFLYQKHRKEKNYAKYLQGLAVFILNIHFAIFSLVGKFSITRTVPFRIKNAFYVIVSS